MDTFQFLDCSIDNNINREPEVFSNKHTHSDLSFNVPDKRFKLKPSNNEQQVKQQQNQQPNPDLLKLNLSNKKELKNKLLDFDINRNFEDIYWLSLKDKSAKSTASASSFPPIFDRNFFKPKHGMNNYQLIKFENRYQQQLMLQQQLQQQPLHNKNNGTTKRTEKNYSVTESISKTAAVLVDLNRQSLSSLHSMPIVNENFRNRYFENYLHNRKISIAQNNPSSSANTNTSSSSHVNTYNNNYRNNNDNKHTENSNKKNTDESNFSTLNTIYFKPTFNLADTCSFDSDDDKLAGSPKLEPTEVHKPVQNSIKPEFSIRRSSKKFNYKRTVFEEPTNDEVKNKEDLQFQFRLKPLIETSSIQFEEQNDTLNALNVSQTPTPKKTAKREHKQPNSKQSIQETIELLSKKISENLRSNSNSKTRLTKLNQYGKETKMDEDSNSQHVTAATTNLSLTAQIPDTAKPSFKKPKPIIDIKSRKQSTVVDNQKNDLMINLKKPIAHTDGSKSKQDPNFIEDFNYIRVESPHKLGKAAGDGYKFIASSSIQVNSTNSFKNTSNKNQFDNFQSNYYENSTSVKTNSSKTV